MADHARESRSRGWRGLRLLVVATGIALAPLFFADMFRNVKDLMHSAVSWSWIVPAATEGSFLFLFLLDILLLLARKPQRWLRYAPYLFAAVSLTLNVWAGHGRPLPMIGYGAVTLAFFVPIVAGEQAVRSMSVTDQDVRYEAEMKAAMRHARDLVRSYAGWRYWRAPSLLRIQVRHSRPPAAVAAAVRDGASFGGAVKWEEPVEEWVIRSLTRNARLAARITAEQRAIETTAAPPGDTPQPRQPSRQKTRQPAASDVARRRARAKRLLSAVPPPTLAEVAEKTGLSERTLSRIKREMPVQLRPPAVGG